MNARQRRMRLPDYLSHMREAAQLAQKHVGNVSKDEFLLSRMMQQAVLMNLVIIGEAATQIRDEYPEFVDANPNPALPWHQMIGMRNRVAHVYFDVDLDVVWVAVKNHLPALEHYLAGLPELAGTLSDPNADDSA